MEILEVVYCGWFHLRRQVKRDARNGLSQSLTAKHGENGQARSQSSKKKSLTKQTEKKEREKRKKTENDTKENPGREGAPVTEAS